jgi:hypothetical protein
MIGDDYYRAEGWHTFGANYVDPAEDAETKTD